jgi:ADP-ribosylation factor family
MGANLSKALGLFIFLFQPAPHNLKYFFVHFKGKIFGNKEMRLLMLGLDAAGKTSESITGFEHTVLTACCNSNSL